MRQTVIFGKKEILESWRSYKILIFLVFFILFGMLSPFTAKLTPLLMGKLLPADITIEFPEPSYLDAWQQYFKNMSQLGLIVVIIVFGGLLADEYGKNTLPMLLTKGLGSRAVVLGKFLANGLILATTYLLGFLVCLLYTWIYFDKWASVGIVTATAALLLIYCFLLAMFLFWGSLLQKVSYVLLASLISLGALAIVNLHHAVPTWNPLSLLGVGMQGGSVGDYQGAIWLSLLFISLFLSGATFFLQKKEI